MGWLRPPHPAGGQFPPFGRTRVGSSGWTLGGAMVRHARDNQPRTPRWHSTTRVVPDTTHASSGGVPDGDGHPWVRAWPVTRS